MRVLFVSSDWSQVSKTELLPGGAGYYRCALPAAALNEFAPGIEAFHTPQFQQRNGVIEGVTITGDVIDNIDCIVFQRWMSEHGVRVALQARAAGQTVVNDLDDAYWSLATTNSAFAASHPRPKALAAGKNRSAVRAETRMSRKGGGGPGPGRGSGAALLDPLLVREAASLNPHETGVSRNNYWKMLAASDYITTSTPYLAAKLERTGRPIHVVANMIDLRLWERQAVTDSRQPTVGWVGAVPWRSGDLETLRGVLPSFMNKHDLRFIHGGDHPQAKTAAELLGVAPERSTSRPMVTIDRYPELWQGIEIGLCPLSTIPFNRAKCLDFSTLVSTERGLVPVGSVGEGEKVWNGDSWVTVQATKHLKPKMGLRITTGQGRELLVTNEHRLWVNGVVSTSMPRGTREMQAKELRDEGLSYKVIASRLGVSIGTAHRDVNDSATTEGSLEPSPEPPEAAFGWTRSDALQVGHLLSVEPWRFSLTKQQLRVPLFHGRRSRLGYQPDPTSSSLPIVEIDETWGELFGFLASDGSLSKTSVSVACDGQDQDVIERVQQLFAKIGLGSTAVEDSRGGTGRRWYVSSAGAMFVDFLTMIGLCTDRNLVTGKPQRTPCVPDVIMRSPASVVGAFLRAYFEGDGTTNGTGISATSKEKKLIQDVQHLLLGFGITSSISSHKGPVPYEKNTYWTVSLCRREADIFRRYIGFVGERKIARLSSMTGHVPSGATKELRCDDAIVSIEPCELRPVDIQVAGAEFVAGGIRSHNSSIKRMEGAAAGVPCVAQKIDPYESFGAPHIARRPVDWTRHLERLIEPAERQRVADVSYELVKAEDVHHRWQDWASLYLA